MAVARKTITPAAERVHFNLDTFEREGGAKEVFAAVIAERRIEMVDPVELDWQDLNDLDTPDEFLRFCFTPEDKEFFMAQKITAWRLNGLMEAYMKHYGLGDKGKGRA